MLYPYKVRRCLRAHGTHSIGLPDASEVVEGRKLAAKDVGGTSDPYPVVGLVNDSGELERKAWSTWTGPVRDFTLNPLWNYSCTVYAQQSLAHGITPCNAGGEGRETERRGRLGG